MSVCDVCEWYMFVVHVCVYGLCARFVHVHGVQVCTQARIVHFLFLGSSPNDGRSEPTGRSGDNPVTPRGAAKPDTFFEPLHRLIFPRASAGGSSSAPKRQAGARGCSSWSEGVMASYSPGGKSRAASAGGAWALRLLQAPCRGAEGRARLLGGKQERRPQGFSPAMGPVCFGNSSGEGRGWSGGGTGCRRGLGRETGASAPFLLFPKTERLVERAIESILFGFCFGLQEVLERPGFTP